MPPVFFYPARIGIHAASAKFAVLHRPFKRPSGLPPREIWQKDWVASSSCHFTPSTSDSNNHKTAN
jgi:hypothetical protein